MNTTPSHSAPRTLRLNTAHLADQPLLALEILRGPAAESVHRVERERFLIGGSANCDLALGDETLPALHSILIREEDGLRLEALVPAPPLVVNGQTVESVRIKDGDLIQLGATEIRVRHRPAVLVFDGGADESLLSADDEPLRSPADMSAAELVACIEADEQLIAEFEGRRATGARAFMQAVLARSAREDDRNILPLNSARSLEQAQGPAALKRRLRLLAERRANAAAVSEEQTPAEPTRSLPLPSVRAANSETNRKAA